MWNCLNWGREESEEEKFFILGWDVGYYFYKVKKRLVKLCYLYYIIYWFLFIEGMKLLSWVGKMLDVGVFWLIFVVYSRLF